MQPVVDMRLDLLDAIHLMDLIDVCRQLASEEPRYAFGTVPEFLG